MSRMHLIHGIQSAVSPCRSVKLVALEVSLEEPKLVCQVVLRKHHYTIRMDPGE